MLISLNLHRMWTTPSIHSLSSLPPLYPCPSWALSSSSPRLPSRSLSLSLRLQSRAGARPLLDWDWREVLCSAAFDTSKTIPYHSFTLTDETPAMSEMNIINMDGTNRRQRHQNWLGFSLSNSSSTSPHSAGSHHVSIFEAFNSFPPGRLTANPSLCMLAPWSFISFNLVRWRHCLQFIVQWYEFTVQFASHERRKKKDPVIFRLI